MPVFKKLQHLKCCDITRRSKLMPLHTCNMAFFDVITGFKGAPLK